MCVCMIMGMGGRELKWYLSGDLRVASVCMHVGT